MVVRYNTLNEMLEHAFTSYKTLPAFTCLGHTLTYADLDDLSARLASYFQHDLGLKPGDRIALQMPNVLQYPVAVYAALRAGLVLVNTNPLYTGRELKHQLCDSGAKALVVLANVAGAASEIIAETDVEHVIVTQIADLHPFPKRPLINFVVKHVKKMVPDYNIPNSINFRDAIAKPAKPLSPLDVSGDSIVALQYTGGTTGVSKGAMLSHYNLTSNVWQSINHLPEAFNEGKDVLIACLPVYHIYAFTFHCLAGFSYGEHSILIPNPRDIDSIVKAVTPIQMTVFVGINTLYVALCHNEAFKKVDFSKLGISCAGGMAMTEDAAQLWRKVTGCEICEGYGLTETSPVLCGNQINNIKRGTIGVPLGDTEIKLIDEEGNTVEDGEVGEICARGPQVMQGYWKREDETQKVLSEDGWLKTGDMALRDEDGYYKIVDRKKDMILVSGFNVYPNEIEDVITQHPNVIEAAAIGVADERSGEVVKLFIVADEQGVSEDEVKQYCKDKLTGYKRPKYVEFKETLPKSNVGKILRRELRDAS